jgi:hypothetical protein
VKLFSSDNDIRKGIGFLPLLLCLLPTVQTVTPLWSEPLLYGSAIGSVLCAFFCIYGLCRGKHLLWRLDFVDLLVFCWWQYVLVRGYMPSEVPCARQVVTYTSLFVLYLMLRLLFSITVLTKYPLSNFNPEFMLNFATSSLKTE